VNRLSLHTFASDESHLFAVCWRTGERTFGLVKVEMAERVGTDPLEREVAAELVAMRYLLEEREVCGTGKVGAGLMITTRYRDVQQLCESEHPSPYLAAHAAFLRVRFIGCRICLEYESEPDWLGPLLNAEAVQTDTVQGAIPAPVLLTVGEAGAVEVTWHVISMFCERFNVRKDRAWRLLERRARSAVRIEVPRGRFADLFHEDHGIFLISRETSTVFVVSEPTRLGVLPRLVTCYKADARHLKALGHLQRSGSLRPWTPEV
jgi:hypothetical protein